MARSVSVEQLTPPPPKASFLPPSVHSRSGSGSGSSSAAHRGVSRKISARKKAARENASLPDLFHGDEVPFLPFFPSQVQLISHPSPGRQEELTCRGDESCKL